MCLILVAWRSQRDYPLVVAANRDEFHARGSAVAAPWADAPGIVGGRDLVAGGTWLAATRDGRFAAITNVREPGAAPGRRSRGLLPQAFLAGTMSPQAFVAAIDPAEFSGFNLLAADTETLCYFSNRDPDCGRGALVLPAGIYGLSNHRLDTPWPKLASARSRFVRALKTLPDESEFFALLADDEIVADADLPSTGVALAWERTLSAVFVRSQAYGTRASTLFLRERSGAGLLVERSFDAAGRATSEARLVV